MSTESTKIPANYFQEQEGILAVQGAALALRCIWRPTPNADLGIDGQLELIAESGDTTGKIVAVQIKSGHSYVENTDGHTIIYYPGDKHRNYWANFPIPVILAIHDPATERVSRSWSIAGPISSELAHAAIGNSASPASLDIASYQVLSAPARWAIHGCLRR